MELNNQEKDLLIAELNILLNDSNYSRTSKVIINNVLRKLHD